MPGLGGMPLVPPGRTRGGGPEQVGGQHLDALVERALVHLADRRGRSRRAAGPHDGPHPLIGPGPDPLARVDRHEALADGGVVRPSLRLRPGQQLLDARTTDAVDPTGAGTGKERAKRGGSWFSGPLGVRASVRDFHAPEYKYTDVGVRCAGN